MALPKKESRLISVTGKTFRWIVSPDSGYMVLVVELDGVKGQRLEVTFSYDDEQDLVTGLNTQRLQITPEVVSSCIKKALSSGWRPDTSGVAPMCIRYQEEVM